MPEKNIQLVVERVGHSIPYGADLLKDADLSRPTDINGEPRKLSLLQNTHMELS